MLVYCYGVDVEKGGEKRKDMLKEEVNWMHKILEDII